MKLKLTLIGAAAALLMTTGTLAQESASAVGSWAGELVMGRNAFEITFNVSEQDGNYSAAVISPKLGVYGMPAESVKVENNRITIILELMAAEYTGRLRLDDSGTRVTVIDGEWFQEGEMVPIILRPAEN